MPNIALVTRLIKPGHFFEPDSCFKWHRLLRSTLVLVKRESSMTNFMDLIHNSPLTIDDWDPEVSDTTGDAIITLAGTKDNPFIVLPAAMQ